MAKHTANPSIANTAREVDARVNSIAALGTGRHRFLAVYVAGVVPPKPVRAHVSYIAGVARAASENLEVVL